MAEESAHKADFNGLVAGLATSALALLSQVEILFESPEKVADVQGEGAKPLTPEQVKKRLADGLGGARRLIDTLAVLEAKTRGNLTGEEQELLASALSDLRLRFVSLSNRKLPDREGGEGKEA